MLGFSGLAVLALLLLAIPYIIPLERIQQEAAVKISSLTGQDVTFSESSRQFGFPLPHFSLRNVEVGGTEAATPLLSASRIDVELDVSSLLTGKTEVAALTIIRPKINLATDAAGASNWRSSTSLLSLFDPRELTKRNQIPANLRVGNIKIVKGTVSYTDANAQIHHQLEAVNLTLHWPDISRPFSLQGAFIHGQSPVRFTAGLQNPAALFRKNISTFELQLHTAALNAQLVGEIFAGKQMQVEAQLKMSSPSLHALAQWSAANAETVPDTGAINGSARLRMSDHDLVLDDAVLQIGTSEAEGYLALRNSGPRPSLQGTLDFDHIDLQPFFNVEAGAVTDSTGWGTRDITGDNLSPFDMDFRLSAEKLLLAKTAIENAALSILTRDDRVELSLGQGQFYGGQVTGRLVTQTRETGGVKILGAVSLADIHLDNALREMFGIVRLTGKGALSLDFNGEGRTASEVVNSLNGEARIRMTEGSFAGIDMATLMQRAKDNPVEAFLEARSGQSTVDDASARFLINNGIAVTEDGSVTGPGYQMSLKGRILLGVQEVDINGLLQPPIGVIPSFDLPFIIRGTWNDPVIAPSSASLVRPSTPSVQN